MTRCTACGADNKAVAKFCRQCGASLAGSAVPGAQDDERTVMMPPPGAVPAKPAAPAATAGADMTPIFPRPAAHRVASTDALIPPPPVQPPPAAPRTAYRGAAATQPVKKSQAPLLIGLGLVALAVLGAGGYFAWTLTRPTRQEPASPPPAAQAPVPAAPAAPPPAAVPVAPSPAAADATPASPLEPAAIPAAADIQAPAAAPPPTPEAVPEAAEVPKAASPVKSKETPKDKPGRAERAKRKDPADAKSQASAPAATPEPAAAPEPPAAAVPPPDPQTARFARMQEELRACGTFNVFCQERVRWKYCSGYWGKVPQCPGGSRAGEGG